MLPHRRSGSFKYQPAKAEIAQTIMHILIADDHAEVRRGLRDILADAFPDAQYSEADDGDKVVSLVANSQFDLVLLDLNMPGRSGMDVLRDVKSTYSRLPVIVVSSQPKDQYAMCCFREGASAYIDKDCAPEELAPTTKKLLDAGREFTPHINERKIANYEKDIETEYR
jgi:DNA-binding NarL/FixJ family response regulator